ncbi:MAG: hypothetical protein ACRCWY_11510 [Cellulosilyticaceae bacterium]
MRHEYKKVSRIVDELTTFFLEHRAKEISLNIEMKDDHEVITIKACPIDHMKKVIDNLQRMLSNPRESEMEEYFWELAGECDYSSESCELSLVGSMIDSASIDYDDEQICLELIRRR